MASSPYAELGEALTALEARGMAAGLANGDHVTQALKEVGASRREQMSKLMARAGLGHNQPELSVAVLEAIAGAKSVKRDSTPVWTMPGNAADIGRLTSQFYTLVQGAHASVTCATYNFSPKSRMWKVLQEVSERPGVKVAVYVDADKADAAQVKAQMPKASVYRSAVLADGQQVVSHAKFVIIDHVAMLLTSANFSFNAENRNVEFGLLVNDPGLCESVEQTMFDKRGVLYEAV